MRKHVYEIDENEIQKYQVWRFLSEDDELAQDEATVVSYEQIPNSIPSEISIHYAIFTARDSTTYSGYVYSEATSELSLLQPVIICGDIQIPFWWGMIKPSPEQVRQYYDVLGLERKQLFPITWASQVVFPGTVTTGRLNGFSYFRSLKRKRIAKVR